MPTIARTDNGNQETKPLKLPYEAHEPDLIHPGEDFTVQVTTISKSILDVYASKLKKGQYGNNYFVLMSHFGIGSNQGDMPSTTINYVEECDQIQSNVLSFWGENIRWIQDYRDQGSDGNAGRVYIGTSAFCQGIGDSPLASILSTFKEVSGIVGRFSPAMAPYASVATHALDGIVKISEKIHKNPGEVVRAALTLYPQTMGSLPAGNAYLQRGSYVFFFEDTVTENLHLTPSGEVVASAGFEGAIPPYVVVNIMDGLIDAPQSEVLDKAVALDILEKYNDRFGILTDAKNIGSGSALNDGLEAIGKSYRVYTKLKRYAELRGKASLRPSEESRLASLKEELAKEFPELGM